MTVTECSDNAKLLVKYSIIKFLQVVFESTWKLIFFIHMIFTIWDLLLKEFRPVGI